MSIRRARPTFRHAFTGFRRDEGGAFAIMGIFFFMILALSAGIAIDINRSEMNRKRMQYAADNAALAATVIPDDDEAIAEAWEYLSAAGVESDEAIVEVEMVGSHRMIKISGTAQTDTLLMRMLGQDVLPQPFLSGAMADTVGIELSLVLDISGSMDDGQKFPKLKAAANTFLDTVFLNGAGSTSISIVPYDNAVKLPADLAALLPLSTEHDLSNCVRFDEFDTTGIPTSGVIERIAHYDRDSTKAPPGGVTDAPCQPDDFREVLAWSNDLGALKQKVTDLQNDRSTAIDLGARVGAMLLDPDLRPMMDKMIDAGQVPARFRGRPYEYDDGRTRKVMILVTDGRNRRQWDLRDDRKSGPSGVFVSPKSSSTTILLKPDETDEPNSECIVGSERHDMITAGFAALLPAHGNCDGHRGYWPAAGDALPSGDPVTWSFGVDSDMTQHPGTYHAPWWDFPRFHDVFEDVAVDRDGDVENKVDEDDVEFSIWSEGRGKFWIASTNTYQDAPEGGPQAIELSYPELFAMMPLRVIVNDLLNGADWNDKKRFHHDLSVNNSAHWEFEDTASMDSNLQEICTAARDTGIMVFTIALEVGEDERQVMRNCVDNDDTKYFTAGEDTLSTVFDNIAGQIARVRLVQ